MTAWRTLPARERVETSANLPERTFAEDLDEKPLDPFATSQGRAIALPTFLAKLRPAR